MKFFLGLIMVSCSFAALAQNAEEPSLFPELSGFATTQQPAVQTNDTVVETEKEEEDFSEDEIITEEEDLFKETETPTVATEEPTNETKDSAEEEDEEDEKEQYIYIVVDDVKATLTPNRNASFCSAAFAVANGLKKELKAFSGSFTVGSMTKEFKFTNVPKEQAAAAKYMFVGTSCEEILNPPSYTIQTCQVEGWSEKKCKSKVQFVPIPKQENTLE